MKGKLFKISEVAMLTGVSRQALIYYDKENILKPAMIDEDNNYRYYSANQIHHIQIINILKEFGMSLNDIRDFTAKRNKDELLSLIANMKDFMQKRIEQSKNFLEILSLKEKFIQISKNVSDNTGIIIEKRKPFTVLCSEKLSAEQQGGGHYKTAFDFEQHLKEHNVVGLSLDTIVEQECLTEDYDDQISYFCLNINAPNNDIRKKKIKGGLYAVIYHKGEFKNSHLTYKKLITYINENGYTISGDAYERRITDYFTEENEENYLLEIAVKVSQK